MSLSRREFSDEGGPGWRIQRRLHHDAVPGSCCPSWHRPRPRSSTPRAPAKGPALSSWAAASPGLASAYELGKLGYTCTLLEARERIGGRNWTVRNGTKVDFTNGFTQNCAFAPGLYQNVGPARLPSVHQTMLGYCRELGVPLEVEVNTSRSAYLQASKLEWRQNRTKPAGGIRYPRPCLRAAGQVYPARRARSGAEPRRQRADD